MTAGTKELTQALGVAEDWVEGFIHLLGWHDRDRAFTAMVAALHGLRDSMPLDEAVYIGSYLPPALRGHYYEGWHPLGRNLPLTSREAFLERVQDALHGDAGVDAEQVGRALFSLLAARLPQSEVENAKAVTPAELHAFWPS
ncbi:MAG: DUF2267 domain-containing protein [Rhizomicrobium sp.]